jgi:hypothetical protein
MKNKICCLLFSIYIGFSALAQDADNTKNVISTDSQTQTFNMDSLAKEENGPLDIGLDRGIFILTSDGKMQLRILGSIRFAVHYDFLNFPINKTRSLAVLQFKEK